MTVTDLSETHHECVLVASDYSALCELVADRIAVRVRTRPETVLGLATGSTPVGVYRSLIRRHRDEGLDFSHVTCFNLDEYYPMLPESPHSYRTFMWENLFRQINCRCWSVPNGRARSASEIDRDCREYEDRIAQAGGIDLQLLGIGRSGHIGFNEPGSPPDSRTRLVSLHHTTREDAAPSFGGIEAVPTQAVSMGIGTILQARALILMASGVSKTEIVRTSWTGPVTDRVPASWVRTHPDAALCLDAEAASGLS